MIRRVRWIAATKALNISSSCRYSVAASGQQPPENDQRQAPLHIPVMLNEVLDLIVHQTPNFRVCVLNSTRLNQSRTQFSSLNHAIQA